MPKGAIGAQRQINQFSIGVRSKKSSLRYILPRYSVRIGLMDSNLIRVCIFSHNYESGRLTEEKVIKACILFNKIIREKPKV